MSHCGLGVMVAGSGWWFERGEEKRAMSNMLRHHKEVTLLDLYINVSFL